MDVSITTRNLALPDPLRRTVEAKVAHVGRFLDGMDRAEVRFLEERNPRIADKEVCEVTLHGHGHVVRARAAAPDPTTAVDLVVEKLEHGLVKLKGKLVGRSHPRRPLPAPGAPAADPAGGPRPGGPGDEPAGDDEGGPRIVRAKQFPMKPMTPEEAALQMDLLGHSFFLFTNADTGTAAVVYRRHDGDVGLIDGA